MNSLRSKNKIIRFIEGVFYPERRRSIPCIPIPKMEIPIIPPKEKE